MSEATPTQDGATPAPAPQESAPETKEAQTNTGGQVETKTDESAAGVSASSKSDIPKGLKRDMYELRQKNREYRQTLDQLRSEIESLKSQSSSRTAPNNVTGPSQSTSIFENPEAYLHQREQEFIKKTEDAVNKRFADIESQYRIQKEANAAQDWLLAQKDLKDDPDAAEDIAEILLDPEFQAVAKVSPRKAAKLALDEWREKKGLTRGDTKVSAARASGVAPSATGSSASRIWTRGEAEKYLSELPFGHPDRNKRFQEVLKASTEGRVK